MSIVSAVRITKGLSEDEFRGVARGSRQRSMLLDLLNDPGGIQPSDWDYSQSQTRLHGSAGWKAWLGMRTRLDAALDRHGCWIGQLPLGPRGGQRWTVLTDDRIVTERAAAEVFSAMAPQWPGTREELVEAALAVA